jgi:Na+/proline symporter
MAVATNPRTATKIQLVGELVGIGRILMFLLWGIAAMVLIGVSQSEAMKSNLDIRSAIPLLINSQVPNILLGITTAALLYAFISTNTNYLLVWAGIIVNDVITPLKKTPFSLEGHLRAIKYSILGKGIFIFFWGVFYKLEDDILAYTLITGVIWTGAGLITYFGLYWKRTTCAAAYAGVIICMVIPCFHLISQEYWQAYKDLGIESHKIGLASIILAVIVMIVLSLLSRKPTKFVNYGDKVREWELQESNNASKAQ